MAGLAPDNLPAAAGVGDARPDDADPLEVAVPELDPASKMLSVTVNEDGSVDIDLGKPKSAANTGKFYDNLAEDMDASDLAGISEDLIRGIEADDESRREWLEDRAEFIKLLALKVERQTGSSADSAAPVEGQSRVRHPLLLEAVLRFQANASAELLPADGPVKIRDDSAIDSVSADDMSEALEQDMNHYLTSVATEYYPDTDRMLLFTGFGGSGFKKVYRCPIRRRPVSESVDAVDLIVSHSATDLGNAQRITNVVRMPQATMKRMQVLGAYRKVELSQPVAEQPNDAKEQADEISGITPSNTRPEDEQHTLYECYCLIDVPGYEHKEKGEPTGLPLPYKVTIDKTSRLILEIRRNWREDDEMQMPREVFVKFPFVPGFGFYDLGLGHIVGNPTAAATAMWRIMIDAGMFANFPGFLYAKGAGKQNSNEFRVPPGGGAPVDTAGQPINAVVMPLPYHEPGPAMMQLAQDIVQTGQRVGAVADIQVGEGRQDAPVGTTIAMIEQATKVMDAVHKRLHTAQSKEFQLLVDLFRENPEDFWRFNKKPATDWTNQKFLDAINNRDLVPAADPNTSSHMQRLLRAEAVYMMAKDDPSAYDVKQVRLYVLSMLKVKNPERLLQNNPQPPAPDPKAQAALVGAQADMLDAQNKQNELGYKMRNAAVEDQNRDKDRTADLHIADTKLKTEMVIHGDKMAQAQKEHVSGLASDHLKQARDHAHDVGMAGLNAPMPPPEGIV